MENSEITMFTDTIKYSGDEIFIKPLCDFFKIDYDNQCRVINKDHILKTSAGKNTSKILFGDSRERVTLTKKGFIRWIQLINPQIVQANLKGKLEEYQSLIFDFLYGKIERREEMRVKSLRLKKLRSLQNKINLEIRNCEREIRNYINNEVFQAELNYSPSKR